MAYDRKSKGNEQGIAEASEGLDPLERHTFMIHKSTIELLEKLVYEAKDKTNKSDLVRKALQGAYS